MKTTYTKILSVLMLLFVAAMVVSCGENDILEPSVTNKDNAEKLELDTVTSRFKYEYTYNDGVVELNDEHFAWFDPSNVARVKQDVIYLKENTPEKFRPKKGDVFVVNNGSNSFLPFGYMGMVDWVDTDARPIAVHVKDATLEEVYKELDLDVRLNAEQLKNLPFACAVIDDESIEEVNNNNIQSVSRNACNNVSGLESKQNEDDKKPNAKIEVERNPDGYYNIAMPLSFKKKNNKKITITPEGGVRIRPLYSEQRVYIHNSVKEEDYRDEGWIVDYNGRLSCSAVDEDSKDVYRIDGADFYMAFPLAGPLFLNLHYKISLFFESSFLFSAGLKGKQTIIMKTTSNSDTPLTSDNKIDLKWGDGSWKAYFDKLKLSGSIGLEFNFASNLVGVPVAASVKPTFAITGSADLLDKDLLKKNPMNTFDFYAKVGAYYMKNPFKFDDEGFGIWYKWNVISADFFPIFPQFEYAYTNYDKKKHVGSFNYESNPKYALFPNVCLNLAKTKVAFVTEDWLKDNSSDHVVKEVVPVALQAKVNQTKYKAEVGGLNSYTKYYAVPVVEMLGLMKYYGNPVPISEVPSQRICAIGPDYAQTLVDGERMYMTIAYDEKGRPKRIFNTMNAMDTYISYDPLTIKSRDYRINEYGIREYDAPTYITNVVRDEKSGVMTSCRWHDNEDSGTNKFYYDDQYHITGVSNSGTDGWSTMKATWDKRGCLTNIHITDDTGSVTDFTYSYRDDDEYANTQGNWTLATGTFMDDFVFGRLLGRAPSHLPTKLVITSIDKEPNQPATTSVTSCNISYKFAGHEENRYIESEKWSVREDGDGYSLTMPYAYRNITVDEDVLKNDKAVGMNRSMRAKQKSQVASLARIMRKLRLLRH